MRNILATVLAFLACLLCLPAPAQGTRAPESIEVLNPDILYHFSAIDGRGFLRRSPINLPVPFYPGDETGLVALVFTITPDGMVSYVFQELNLAVMATPEMVKAAKDAVQRWEFNPLPPHVEQADHVVRVLIQFNNPASTIRYSQDGRVVIEGPGDRIPVNLPAPRYESDHEGVVKARVTVNPDGSIAWIDKFSGAYEHQRVLPRLGIITHEALRSWRFLPRLRPVAEDEDPQEQVRITFHYMHWKENG
ncbi:MAG: hypothetical protein OHK0039_13710 [Bacteroidia bacterium]